MRHLLERIHNLANECGYSHYLEEYLVFLPKGVLPKPPYPSGQNATCDLWDLIYAAATEINPCFDIYQVSMTCPLQWDTLGISGSISCLPADAEIDFNRTDVQKAINAPLQEWEECSNGVLDTNTSPASGLSVLPSVIERSEQLS
jgi:carboxypeptidase D